MNTIMGTLNLTLRTSQIILEMSIPRTTGDPAAPRVARLDEIPILEAFCARIDRGIAGMCEGATTPITSAGMEIKHLSKVNTKN